jgi:hypothetical protein
VLAHDVAGELAQPQNAEPIMAAATLATKRLAVALIADAELAAQDGAAVETNMLARLNIVDGIFSSQVGVRLQALSVTVMTAGTQPFTTTDSSLLLEQLRDYRLGTPTQRSAGLSHLMTGRNLDGRTIGIAYIACAQPPAPVFRSPQQPAVRCAGGRARDRPCIRRAA